MATATALTESARPIELQKKLGLDNLTIRRLRRRELRDFRDLNHMCKLTAEQIAEIKSNRTVERSYFAHKFGVSTRVISRVRCGRGPYGETKVMSPVQTMKPPVTSSLRIKLNAQLMRSLTEMAQLTVLSGARADLAAYATALIEAAVADFRFKKIPSNFLSLKDNTPPPEVAACDTKPHGRFRGRFSADERERIHAQHDDGGLTPKEIARRWGCSATTIRRALDCD